MNIKEYIEEIENKAHGGYPIDISSFKEFFSQFQSVVIWGAGNLGSAIGKRLQELDISIDAYWDAKWETDSLRNGIPVFPYGGGEFDKDKTLIIFAIANVPVSPKLYQQLIMDKWNNIINGLTILEGIICPFSMEKELDTSVCTSMNICTVCNCQRLSNIMKSKVAQRKNIEEKDVLSFDRVHFIVNNMCNLKCTHCFMYMNSYPNDRKHNIPLDTINRDIDMVMQAIDSFGVVNVFGGETFLHPDISSIVSTILKYESFGSVIVNTNGMASMTEHQLEVLKSPRVRLAFSNYTQALPPEKCMVFEKNIEKTRKMGITVGVQNELPTWNVSSTLSDNGFSVEEMISAKENCGVKFLYVFDGKVFPCAFCLSLYDLGVADYHEDYVDIAECENPAELRMRIIELINHEYNHSCSHCDRNVATTNVAGAQGFDNRYALPG